eukprot:9193_1
MDVIQSMQHSGAVFENFGCGKVVTPGQAVDGTAHNQNQNIQLTAAENVLTLPPLNKKQYATTNFQLNTNHNSNRINEETWQKSTLIAINSLSAKSTSVQRSFNSLAFRQQNQLVDFEAIKKADEKLRKEKEQRGRSKIDNSQKSMKKPMRNYKWVKHSRVLQKDIVRFIIINVTEGSGRVKGQWMEMTNDTWHSINKTFILNIHQQMRKDILEHFWGLSE